MCVCRVWVSAAPGARPAPWFPICAAVGAGGAVEGGHWVLVWGVPCPPYGCGAVWGALGHARRQTSPFPTSPSNFCCSYWVSLGESGESQAWEEKIQSRLGDLDENAWKKKKKKRGSPASARPRFSFCGSSRAVGCVTLVADWKQPCEAGVCSAEVKGGGVRSAAEVGSARWHPCPRGVSPWGVPGRTHWSRG